MPRPTPAMEAPGITKPMQGAAEAKTSMDPRLAAARCSIPPRLRLSDPYTSRVNCANEPRPVCPPTSSPQATVQNEGVGGRRRRRQSACRGCDDLHGLAWRHGLPLTESVLRATAAARPTAGRFQSIPRDPHAMDLGLRRGYSAVTVSPSGPPGLFKGVTTATSCVGVSSLTNLFSFYVVRACSSCMLVFLHFQMQNSDE